MLVYSKSSHILIYSLPTYSFTDKAKIDSIIENKMERWFAVGSDVFPGITDHLYTLLTYCNNASLIIINKWEILLVKFEFPVI